MRRRERKIKRQRGDTGLSLSCQVYRGSNMMTNIRLSRREIERNYVESKLNEQRKWANRPN
jgi:hypothetical protein